MLKHGDTIMRFLEIQNPEISQSLEAGNDGPPSTV
jgi:hypothetical protein